MSHKIGIVGAGGVAEIHAAILANDSRVTIHSMFDLEAGRSKAMASRYGGRAAGSLDELLADCDAVFV